MSVTQSTLLDCLVASPPVRRLLEVVFAAQSRWHLKGFDQLAPARAQLRTLLGLVHNARNTLFGREHDFRRIRSVADFRRLVPLRTPVEQRREYGQPGDTWPADHFGNGSPTNEPVRSTSLSPASLANHCRSIQTAMALIQRIRPHCRLLGGPIVWLRDEDRPTSGESIGTHFPLLIRGAVCAEFDEDSANGCRRNGFSSQTIQRVAHTPPTCLIGPADRVMTLLEKIGGIRGTAAWQELAAVLYSRPDAAFDVAALRERLPKSVVLLELVARPEGIIAVEDPRYNQLRLLPDHGLYFELVPSSTANVLQPPRLGLDEAATGISYELVISSPAGVWACRSGSHVRFEELAPLLFQVVPSVSAVADASGSLAGPLPTIRSDAPATTPMRASHRQSGDNSVALPGSFVRTPWSTPVDRG